MTLTDIATDLKEHVESGQAWFSKVLEQHVPALLAEGQRLGSSPIVQALEGIVLPPETEQAIASLITKFAAAYGASAAPAPPAGAAAAPAPVAALSDAVPAAS